MLTTDHRPTFCTLIDAPIANEHITKDIGLVPYGMHEFQGYDSFIATYVSGDLTEIFPCLKYTPGLRIEAVPKTCDDWDRDALKWLRKNARRIDVLMLLHMNRQAMVKSVIYKTMNPRGKIYQKTSRKPLALAMGMNA